MPYFISGWTLNSMNLKHADTTHTEKMWEHSSLKWTGYMAFQDRESISAGYQVAVNLQQVNRVCVDFIPRRMVGSLWQPQIWPYSTSEIELLSHPIILFSMYIFWCLKICFVTPLNSILFLCWCYYRKWSF